MINTVATTAAAQRLYFDFIAIDAATRPVDRKVALAVFTADTKMAYAFGVGNTPFHVEMVVHDTLRDIERPVYSASNNRTQQAHDLTQISRLFMAINDIAMERDDVDGIKHLNARISL